ncbi:Tar, partial [Pantoea stewartii]|uniref:HAMP domain-containing protein n=1 Tax=Pantoea stewartii TaxID=66269 RepID=UPI0005425DD0
MTITQRLFLTFSLLAASLVTLSIASVMILSGFQSRFQFVQTNVMPSIVILDKIVYGSSQAINWSYRYLVADNPVKKEEYRRGIYDILHSVKKQNQFYLDNYVANAEDKKRLLDELSLIKKIENELPAFTQLVSNRQNDAALTALLGDNGVGQDLRNLVGQYQSHIRFNVDIGESFNQNNTHIYRLTFWALTGTSSFVILVLGFFTVKTILSIRRHLNGMRDVMESASEKLDLTLRADDSRRDEVGLTAGAFNHLSGSVASSLSAVSAAAHSVSSASAQIYAGNEDLSSRTEEQAASLAQTAASMTQLSETVRQTAENTRLASQLS